MYGYQRDNPVQGKLQERRYRLEAVEAEKANITKRRNPGPRSLCLDCRGCEAIRPHRHPEKRPPGIIPQL